MFLNWLVLLQKNNIRTGLTNEVEEVSFVCLEASGKDVLCVEFQCPVINNRNIVYEYESA